MEKRKLDNKMTMLALLVLIGAFVMIIYIVFTYGIGNGLSNF